MLLEIQFLCKDASREPVNSYSRFKERRSLANVHNYLPADKM